MKLRNLKIGTQLRLGFGMLAVLVVLITGFSWYQSNQIWHETEGLYNHPLKVRRAIGALTADILKAQAQIASLSSSRNPQEVEAIARQIELLGADSEKQVDAIYGAYLGPKKDVDAIATALIETQASQAETLRLARSGKIEEVSARLRPEGVERAQTDDMLAQILTVDQFALARGDKFFADAQSHTTSLNLRLFLGAGAALLLALGISWLVMRGIVPPLEGLTVAARRFGEGDLDTRADFVSDSEIGMLSASFNSMADAIQGQVVRAERSAQVIDAMLAENDVHVFAQELVQSLMTSSGSQVGAIYLLNESGSAFELLASIGLDAGARASFSATDHDGELGAAVVTRRIQHLADVPADTRFTFAGVSGEFVPRELLTIPIPHGQSVAAVISLASVRAYDEGTLRMIDDVWGALIARVNGVVAVRGIKTLSHSLELQNRELDAQKRELSAQTSELTEQNTELEMQKRQLDESNRLKSAFLSNMSHELRTPLNSVIALSGVLGRRLAGRIPTNEYSYLEVIERNGKNLLALINDILDLSRIEAGKEELSIGRFSIPELVVEILEMVAPQADENSVGLVNQIDPDLAPVVSDSAKCRHILQNLIANAVKFTEDGMVTVSALQSDDEIQIMVTDTGIGIAADQLPYIFDEFRQADDSTSRKYGGTGLGLAIAREYAHLLSGDITVVSTPGEGSTFTLRLPLTLNLPITEADEDELRAPRGPGRVPAGDGHNECILLVEDSEPAIIQMTDVLTSHGYRVQVARDGREALEQIEQVVPDAMILDLMMPEVDGFEVLDSIRRHERTSHLPVLILTAKHVTKDELGFLKENGILQLIQKGDIDVAGLLGAVERMVAPAAVTVAAPRTDVAPRPGRSGKPLVLVVDDNADNRRAARAVLEADYDVVEAEDGREAVEKAGSHVPDVILMDIVMPAMDGISALKVLRKDQSLCSIPVIVLTASAMSGDRESIMAHGFDGYVSKPIDADVLGETLNAVLGTKE